MVTRLHQASQSLFSRFVDLRQHVELELREATIGDQGTVETCRCQCSSWGVCKVNFRECYR